MANVFDQFDAAGQASGGNVFDAFDKPPEEIGAVGGALRGAGETVLSALQPVRMAGATLPMAIESLANLPEGSLTDPYFKHTDEALNWAHDKLGLGPNQEYTTLGKVGHAVGAIAPMAIPLVRAEGMLGAAGMMAPWAASAGLNRAEDIARAGGTGEDMLRGGATSAVGTEAMGFIPFGAAARLGLSPLARLGVGALGGAAAQAGAIGPGMRALENASLGDNPALAQLRQPIFSKDAAIEDLVAGGLFGGVGGLHRPDMKIPLSAVSDPNVRYQPYTPDGVMGPPNPFPQPQAQPGTPGFVGPNPARGALTQSGLEAGAPPEGVDINKVASATGLNEQADLFHQQRVEEEQRRAQAMADWQANQQRVSPTQIAFQKREAAEKAAEALTKKTGIPHEVINDPRGIEPSKIKFADLPDDKLIVTGAKVKYVVVPKLVDQPLGPPGTGAPGVPPPSALPGLPGGPPDMGMPGARPPQPPEPGIEGPPMPPPGGPPGPGPQLPRQGQPRMPSGPPGPDTGSPAEPPPETGSPSEPPPPPPAVPPAPTELPPTGTAAVREEPIEPAAEPVTELPELAPKEAAQQYDFANTFPKVPESLQRGLAENGREFPENDEQIRADHGEAGNEILNGMLSVADLEHAQKQGHDYTTGKPPIGKAGAARMKDMPGLIEGHRDQLAGMLDQYETMYGADARDQFEKHLRAKADALLSAQEAESTPAPGKIKGFGAGKKTKAATEPAPEGARHVDENGQKRVVNDKTVKKALDKAPAAGLLPKEAGQKLLGEIDTAIASATPHAEAISAANGTINRRGEIEARKISVQFNAEPAVKKAAEAANKRTRQDVVDDMIKSVGHVTFDVPGDGKFKVLNTKERLAEFRDKVAKSPAFSGKKMPGEFGPAFRRGSMRQGEPVPPDENVLESRTTDTPAFHNWFADSKVVDKDGVPQLVYHNSHSVGIEAFDRLFMTRKGTRGVGADTAGIWFSSRPDTEGAGMYGPHQYPAYLSIKNPWRPASFDEFLARFHAAAGRNWREQNPRGLGSSDEFRAWLKQHGYDGVHFPATGEAAAAADARLKRARDAVDEAKTKKEYAEAHRELEVVMRQAARTPHTEFDHQDVWVALEPEQVKSPHSGFDASDPNHLKTTTADHLPEGRFSALGHEPATMKQALDDAREITGLGLDIGIETNDNMPSNVPARLNLDTHKIEFNPRIPMTRAHAALYIAEELWHATDHVGNRRLISSSSPRFNVRRGAIGDIAREIITHLRQGGKFAEFWRYPLDQAHGFSPDRIAAELYARAGALMASDPATFKRHFPVTYDAYRRAVRLVDESPLPGSGVRRQVWSATGRFAESGSHDRNNGSALSGFGAGGPKWQSDPQLGRLRREAAAAFGGSHLGKRADLSGQAADTRYLDARTTQSDETGAAHFGKSFVEHDVVPSLKGAWQGLREAADNIIGLIMPQVRGIGARMIAGILRQHGSDLQARQDQAVEALKNLRAFFRSQSHDDNLKFVDDVEHGREFTDPHFADIAKQLRHWLDMTRDEVRALGTGKLTHFDENYFPHIWKDPKKAEAWMHQALSKRPLEGSKAFTKKRIHDTIKEGMSWKVYDGDKEVRYHDTEAAARADAAAHEGAEVHEPLEPVSYNPVDLTLLKLGEMNRYILGQRVMAEMKQKGLVKFVHALSKAPEGYGKIDDRIAHVYGPREIEVTEHVNRSILEALTKVHTAMGLRHVRMTKFPKGSPRSALGFMQHGGDYVATKFGSELSVLAHEISHHLGDRYNLFNKFSQDPQLARDMRTIADLHEYKKAYFRKPAEKEASLLEAFVEAPDTFKTSAPKLFDAFTKFLSEHEETRPIAELKRTLAAQKLTNKVPLNGLLKLGEYHAPEAVANVINNYLSPGLRGKSGLFRAYLGIGNTMNQFQLGLSAFHLGFTSLDAMTSKFAIGLKYLMDGKASQGLKFIGQSLNPLTAFRNAAEGNKLLQEWMKPGSQGEEIGKIVDALRAAGGRAKIDQFYQTNVTERMKEAFAQGNVIGGVLRSPMAGVEAFSNLILGHVVPRQKLGVFLDMARYELEKLPPDATRDQLREVMGRAWDSVDNRMGQLVYDNLMWNKSVKDIAMASVRSVGWNLGTWREIPGGLIDLGKFAFNKMRKQEAEFTHRIAYVAALPVMAGLLGTLIGSLYGQPPQEAKDLFFPRTGDKDPNGRPMRLSLPSYMKDIFEYFHAPGQTLINKTQPLISTISEMLQNKDYYGTEIRHQDDNVVQQMLQVAKFAGTQMLPFGVRNTARLNEEGAKASTMIGGFVGFPKAPHFIEQTKAEELATEISRNRLTGDPRTQEQTDRSRLVSQIASRFRSGQGVQANAQLREAMQKRQLTASDMSTLQMKMKAPSNLVYQVSRMDAEGALRVFKAGTPQEQRQLLPYLFNKINQARAITPERKRELMKEVQAIRNAA